MLSIQSSFGWIYFLDRSGWYLSGGGSIDWYSTNKVELTVSGTTVSGKHTPETAPGLMFALGYYLNQWRIEAEGAYRNVKGNANFSNGGVNVKRFDHVAEYSVMANAYYDIPICRPEHGFYVGGGLGAAFNELELTGAVKAKSERVRFAYQLMVGGFYEITRCLTLTGGYRLFGISTPKEFQRTSGNTVATVKTRSVPLNHSFEIGLRLSL